LAPADIAPPAVPAVPTAREAHERVNGHAATRQSVLARPVMAPYTRRIVDPPRLKFLSPFAAGGLAGAKSLAGDKLRVTVRHLPLPYHRLARPAAHAAECAGAQHRFWEMHDLLFAKADSLGIKSIDSFARDAGVADSTEFRACEEALRFSGRIETDLALAQAIGAPGTPTIILNGVLEMGLTDSTRLQARLRYLLDSIRNGS
jgi:hypothetical protein